MLAAGPGRRCFDPHFARAWDKIYTVSTPLPSPQFEPASPSFVSTKLWALLSPKLVKARGSTDIAGTDARGYFQVSR